MRVVDFAWVVVALPLLAAVVNLSLTIPNAVRLRRKDLQTTGEQGDGASTLHAEASHQAPGHDHAAGDHATDSHDEHGFLGGPTRIALAGGWFGTLMLLGSF